MASEAQQLFGKLDHQLAGQIRKVEEHAASNRNASVDALARQLRARRRMVRAVMKAEAGDVPAVQALCRFVRDRRQPRAERIYGVMLLGQLDTSVEALDCLEALATNAAEPAGVRWSAMMWLSQTDSAVAFRALHRVLADPRSDGVVVRDDKGTELPLAYWALEFLDETSTGRNFLRTAPRRPRDDPRAWALVIVWWTSAGDASYLPVVEQVAGDPSYPLRTRQLALEVLIFSLLGDRAEGCTTSGWERVASIALARSEPSALRDMANQALRKRPR
jgi:hypothetical protein